MTTPVLRRTLRLLTADDEGGPEATPVGPPIVTERPLRGLQGAFASLDGVDLKDQFKFRACVMQTVLHIMKGAFRLGCAQLLKKCWSVSLNEATYASAEDDAP